MNLYEFISDAINNPTILEAYGVTVRLIQLPTPFRNWAIKLSHEQWTLDLVMEGNGGDILIRTDSGYASNLELGLQIFCHSTWKWVIRGGEFQWSCSKSPQALPRKEFKPNQDWSCLTDATAVPLWTQEMLAAL